MEISESLKNDIKDLQKGLTKAIENHQSLALKLKEDPSLETEYKKELAKVQNHIIELNDKQKVLLRQLRKEIEDNIKNGSSAYNFNLYKIKPGQLESKKRRRKDLSLNSKVVTSLRPTQRSPSLSPSPTPSSSSLSEDSLDYDVTPFMLPVPVPKPRPKLLPNSKENVYLGSVTRRDLRPPKLKKQRQQNLQPPPISDEDVFKDIPVYYDPAPSPPPTDEKDIKSRFMRALALIPKDMLHEIQNRKVERKRRSTATNNPNFVYNNDWEIPVWKRSKTYLSPHKISKIDSAKKCKLDDGQTKKDKDPDAVKRSILDDLKLPPGLIVEKVKNGKSRTATPESTASSDVLCCICRTSGLVSVCKECNACYHLSCISPGSPISCPSCKNKRNSPDEANSEDSSKEEFAAKCPNVAESYNKLKEYIENHTESDTADLIAEKESFKMKLILENQELYIEKRKLEERATELSEALLVQEESKNLLIKEEQKLLGKINIIVNFVKLYQKSDKKDQEDEDESEIEEIKVKSPIPPEPIVIPDEETKSTPDDEPKSPSEIANLKSNELPNDSELPSEEDTTTRGYDQDIANSRMHRTENSDDEYNQDEENFSSPDLSSKDNVENSSLDYYSPLGLSHENTVDDSVENNDLPDDNTADVNLTDNDMGDSSKNVNCQSFSSNSISNVNNEDYEISGSPSVKGLELPQKDSTLLDNPLFQLEESDDNFIEKDSFDYERSDGIDYDLDNDNECY